MTLHIPDEILIVDLLRDFNSPMMESNSSQQSDEQHNQMVGNLVGTNDPGMETMM
jgi:hypothetical protein